MIFRAKLLKGVNDIEFGISYLRVRETLSSHFVSFVMGGSFEPLKDNFPCDYYEEEGIICYYDKGGHLEAMEFLRPSKLMLGDVTDVLSLTMGQATALLERLDPELEVTEEEVTSYPFSLCYRCLEPEEGGDAPVERFVVGRPGYYDAFKPGTDASPGAA